MTQRQRVLAFLEAEGAKGVASGEFLAVYLPSYPKRIFELRREGFQISSERLRAGSWRYTLLAKPDVERRGGVKAIPSGDVCPGSSPSLSVEDGVEGGSGDSRPPAVQEHSPAPSLSVEEEELFDRTIPA